MCKASRFKRSLAWMRHCWLCYRKWRRQVVTLVHRLIKPNRKPVYGLIFLFRYVEDDFIQQESTCPEHVWFSNQVSRHRLNDQSVGTNVIRPPAMLVPPLLCSTSS